MRGRGVTLRPESSAILIMCGVDPGNGRIQDRDMFIQDRDPERTFPSLYIGGTCSEFVLFCVNDCPETGENARGKIGICEGKLEFGAGGIKF